MWIWALALQRVSNITLGKLLPFSFLKMGTITWYKHWEDTIFYGKRFINKWKEWIFLDYLLINCLGKQDLWRNVQVTICTELACRRGKRQETWSGKLTWPQREEWGSGGRRAGRRKVKRKPSLCLPIGSKEKWLFEKIWEVFSHIIP